GDARLGFPPLDHPLLQDDEDALRFFRAFLPLDDSESIRSAALGYAAAEDAVERVRGNVWLRALLQRQLAVRWDSRLQAVLVEAMADPADRADLVEHQRTALAAVGLEWLSTQLVEEFGLLLPPPKQRPFKIPRRTDARPEWRDTADVTVVIPSYRHERYIAATIASVLAQSAPALRVLVADDRSPDGTVAAARAIEDPRLEVRVNETNVGLGNSVLAALAAVETPFVALLNSDDLFHPKRLEKCLAVLRDDTGCDLVSTGLALIDRDGKRLGPSNTSALFHGRNVRDWVRWYEASTPASWRKDALFGALLERNFLATSSNIVCRTDWLRAHGDALRSLKYCLDWQLFLDAAREQRLRWLPDKLIAYRLHPSNTVWFEPEKRWAYSLEVNRVAARAVRDHIAPLPDDSAERVLLALQDVAAHLRHNTEVDWTGLYLNELIGGYRLEQHAGESPRVAELAADLERTAWQTSDPATAAERRRAGALASKFAATRDEVYSLQSRDEWQRRRIEEDNARLRQAQDRFDATQRALDAKQAEAAALEQRLQEL
ncbi:MAG: glycosyltransferase, partial [Planctomycetes bacterium]|nr:glycosyltransferase [Planctomycetota bacterium]